MLHQYAGTHAVFLCSAIGAALWLLLALSMSRPEKLSSYIYKIDGGEPEAAEQLAQRLLALAGVAEAVVVAEEGVAYLKVDKHQLDQNALLAYSVAEGAA